MSELRSLSRLAGALVVVLGILTLVGWTFGIGLLKSVFPGLVSMKVNTAVCFVLAGYSLILQAQPEPISSTRLRLARGLAVLAALAGGLTLFEYVFDLDLRLDEVLFHEPSKEPGSVFPGRMSPVTSLNFVLTGLGLLVLDAPHRASRRWPAQYFALAAALVTLLDFEGYFYGVETPYRIGQYLAIALHSVLSFWLLSLGILFARPQRGLMVMFTGDNPGGILARRMLPAVILVPLLAGWLRVVGQRAGLYGVGFGAALSTSLLIVTFAGLVVWAARALDRADAERREGAEALRHTNARLDGILSSAVESERREHARRMELEALMEGAPVLVWVAQDPECQRVTGNRAAQEMLRVSDDANVLKSAPNAPHHFEILRDGVVVPNEALPMQTAGREGKPVFGQELELRFANGSSRWIYGNAVPLPRGDGSVRGVIAAFVDITALKQTEKELSLSRENLRGLAARLQAVREEERTLLAREIHDVLAQELTRLKIDITWISRQLIQPGDSAKQLPLKQRLEGMAELTDATIASVQRIATELRPVVLDTLGLCAAIEWQAKDFEARAGIVCSVAVPEVDLPLERDRSTALFRILQESLTNVARHSKATRVEIQLTSDDSGVSLQVCDNGRGILAAELNDPHSVGLLGMRERAALLGGECRITRRPNGGTSVEARLGHGTL